MGLNDINRIILASESDNINIEPYLETINYCFNNSIFFLRSLNSGFIKKIISPKLKKRSSLHISNIFEFLIDENPNWKNYPKRAHSLIGLIAIDDPIPEYISHMLTSTYGDNLYYVFPKKLFSDNIAFINNFDFINVLKSLNTNFRTSYHFYDFIIEKIFGLPGNYKFKSINDFDFHCDRIDNSLTEILNYIESTDLTPDNAYDFYIKLINYKKMSYYNLFNNLMELFERLNKIDKDSLYSKKTTYKFFKDYIKELNNCLSLGFKQYLWNIMQPYDCHILTENTINKIEDCEFWTEEECLLINKDYVEMLNKEIGR